MTTEPTEEARPGSGQDNLRDEDMTEPYPDDTPGGVQDAANPDGEGKANREEAAEDMGPDNESRS